MRQGGWLAGVLIAASLAMFSGCGGSTGGGGFDEEAAKSALAELPYEIEYRDVSTPGGADGALAGTIIGPTGERVDFALTIADQSKRVHLLAVPGAIGSGAYFKNRFYLQTNESIANPSRNPRRQQLRFALAGALEDALCKKAYGSTCGF
jgi:hypothetical protein